MRDPLTPHDHLIRGLATPHEHAYNTNVHFRTALDMFAKMLPSMVNGLALEAARQEEAWVERYREVLGRPINPRSWLDDVTLFKRPGE